MRERGIDSLGGLTCVQPTLYQAQPTGLGHLTLYSAPTMTTASEKVVLMRLRALHHADRAASERDVLWCVQMLDRVPHNAAIGTEACCALERHTAANPGLCGPLMRGAPRACCRLISLHPTVPGVQSHACGVLAALAGHDAHAIAAECVREHGILHLVHQAIGRFTDNAAVMSRVLTVLQRVLEAGMEFRLALAEVGTASISAVAALVGRFKGNPSVGPLAQRVCRLIADVPELGAGLAQAGGVRQLLAMARTQPLLPTDALCKVMASVALEAATEDLFEHGPQQPDPAASPQPQITGSPRDRDKDPAHAEAVLAVLDTCPGDAPLVSEALRLLYRLAHRGETYEASKVLPLLERHRTHPSVAAAACMALHQICSIPQQRADISSVAALQAALDALRSAGGEVDRPSPPAVARICALLCRLFMHQPDVCRRAVDLGAPGVLLTACVVLPHWPSCLRFAVSALLCLCCDAECRGSVAETALAELAECPGRCALDVLIGALPSQYGDRPLQALLCGLLKAVCMDSRDAARRAASRGASRIVRKLLWVAFEQRDRVLFAEAAGFGRGVARSPDVAMAIADSQGLEQLLDACQYFGRHAADDAETAPDPRLVTGEKALAEGALCVLRLALANPDVGDGLNILLRRVAAGYRSAEILRVTYDAHARGGLGGFVVGAALGDVRGSNAHQCWLNSWQEPSGWFRAASHRGDRQTPEQRAQSVKARRMRVALADPEAIIAAGDTPWTLGYDG